MAGDEVRVDPNDLRRKAGQIEAISWGNNPVEVPAVPADALSTARTAVDNLNMNARSLAEYQEYGKKQGRRLAETLRLVAVAYETVDQNAMDNINNTIPGEAPAPPAPVTPGANTVAAPIAPQPLPTQRGMPTDEYLDVEAAQSSLLNGDQAASLQTAAATWTANATSLAAAAANFETADVNWEGEAADAAYRQFADYRGFLVELSGAWSRLAAEAEKVAAAHHSTLGEHTPIFTQYEQLKAQLPAAIANGGSAARVIQLQMEELQKESEDVRQQYARKAQPDEVNPPEPPKNAGTPPTPVRSNGDPRKRAGLPQDPGTGSGGGQQAPRDGSGGAPQSPAQDAPVSPMSAADQASQAAQQGGQQGGGSPGGGQPGGGSPGGGSPSGAPPGAGMPGLGKGEPKLPTDPSLRPAAAGGGGAGSGSGGGGGGMPGSPLQPAVGAETVAPTPFAAPVAPAAAGGGASGSGGTAGGGGMGGMAPMMHGAQGGAGEKKRNPQLSQDEELYTEDRPWTEAVIGNQARRRGAPGDTRKESQ